MWRVGWRDDARYAKVVDGALTISIEDEDWFVHRGLFSREIKTGSASRMGGCHCGDQLISVPIIRRYYNVTSFDRLSGRKSHLAARDCFHFCVETYVPPRQSAHELLSNRTH